MKVVYYVRYSPAKWRNLFIYLSTHAQPPILTNDDEP